MKFRITMTLLLLGLVMIFAVQNVAVVDLKFLIWHGSIPRSLLIFLMLLIGIAIGWFARVIVAGAVRARDGMPVGAGLMLRYMT